METRDRVAMGELTAIDRRCEPTPRPYMLHIREGFNNDGTVVVIHKKRVYENGDIVDEKLG